MGTSDLTVKLRKAFDEPSLVSHYLKSNLLMNYRYLAERKLAHALGGLTDDTLGWNAYVELLRYLLPADRIVAEVHGVEMILELSEIGISRDLLMYGTREHYSTGVLREEVRHLARDAEGDVTVLELGANIGYYALQEADILGDKADIHAFEPAPWNFGQLEKNIRLNGYENSVTTQNMAVGSESDEVHLHLSNQSNLHRIVDDVSDETVTVPVTTVEDYLDENGIDYGDVMLVRMDVQGYESEVYKGMRSVMRESEDLVVFIEFHPGVDTNGLAAMIDDLDGNDFEIVSSLTSKGTQAWYEYESDVRELEDLQHISGSVQLILRKR